MKITLLFKRIYTILELKNKAVPLYLGLYGCLKWKDPFKIRALGLLPHYIPYTVQHWQQPVLPSAPHMSRASTPSLQRTDSTILQCFSKRDHGGIRRWTDKEALERGIKKTLQAGVTA